MTNIGFRSVRRTSISLMAVAVVMSSTGLVSAEELKLTLKDARITIVAENVTLQEILAEWTRVGQTEFVGADSLVDQRVTVQLFDVAEAHALEVLLRSTAGYLARYRTRPADSPSSFDRVRILARSESLTASHGAAMPPANEQVLPQPPNGGVTYSARQAGVDAPGPEKRATAPVPRFATLSPLERAGQRLSRPSPQGRAAPTTPPAKTLPAAPAIPSNPFYNPPRPK